MTIFLIVLRVIATLILIVLLLLVALILIPIKVTFSVKSENQLLCVLQLSVLGGLYNFKLHITHGNYSFFEYIFFTPLKVNILSRLITKKNDATSSVKREQKQKAKSLPHISTKDICNLSYFIKAFYSSIKLSLNYADVDFACKEVDITGMVCGMLSLFPAIYDERFSIRPDFSADELYFSGIVQGSIRILLFTLLISFIKMKLKNI